MNEIELLADFFIFDVLHGGFLIVNVNDSVGLFFVDFLKVGPYFFPFLFEEAFVSETLNGLNEGFEFFGFEEDIVEDVGIVSLNFELLVVSGMGFDMFLKFGGLVDEVIDLFFDLFDVDDGPWLGHDLMFVGFEGLVQFPDLFIVGEIGGEFGHGLFVVLFH